MKKELNEAIELLLSLDKKSMNLFSDELKVIAERIHTAYSSNQTEGKPEEIEKLIKDSIYKEVKADGQSDEYFENAWTVWWGLMDTDFRNGMTKSFKKCRVESVSNKYTEEDLKKAIEETIKACNLAQKESYGDLEIDVDKIIQSLNKQ